MKLKEAIVNFSKGFAMGAANVIPGVSGGTIALITGIFERLIDSLKSFDLKALKLLFKGKFKEFAEYTDFWFLLIVFFGAVVSIMTFAKVLDYLFVNYPIFIWSYFFGLILASVYFVGKTVEKWTFSVITFFVLGVATAVIITILNPAKENDSFWYLLLCGIIAISSMILPGLSGSFVLILLGNYHLVMIDAVNNLSNALEGDFSTFMQAMKIILPVAIGVVVGLLAFSYFLSWIYKKYKNQTISTLTGFILGSLAILWPWKKSYDSAGNLINTDKFGKLLTSGNVQVFSYKRILPEIDSVFFIAVIIAIAGVATIWLIEKFASNKELGNE